MALTPEDVVNKRFQTTKFREGYDQDEVDDFLDEIVVELRRLNQENDELRRQVSELQGGAGSESSQAAVPAPVSADGQSAETPAEEPATQPEAPEDHQPQAEASGQSEAPATEQAAPVAGPQSAAGFANNDQYGTGAVPQQANVQTNADANSAAGVLAMAQRLHDEYVAEGQQTRDRIISDAQAEADKLVSDAQEQSRKTLNEFEQKKSVLEREVEELRGFERDYRSRLRAFIEGQLQDLDSQSRIAE
ncbi:DivIVA domain-containing protein [Auritidibacter ignavus]|uniref:Cell wall synthesis protein Wag31 n=1 Tax=Auritidibacter ignavus TaxID=678932 RepID=A0AAJ6AJR1_9MICC|nr:DivIVA domain-containing protein [Auritidibacter ignavus]WGH86909.1 DivIVA domain-containing protein [Auritidibacter ignavus]WGH89194.1 DivIVA domain-containing protein [Auritidibacter ignavus]WGH93967.1 DivIVA domain-containing protein [Auritidibacter ignavus]WHS34660.1 DivIVA domain-containing protein [Auritidibacter ignavus]